MFSYVRIGIITACTARLIPEKRETASLPPRIFHTRKAGAESMAEYNFEPDFQKWWENPSATQEEFSWVLLGIDPVHIERLKEIRAKTTEETLEETRFRGRLDHYIMSLPRGMSLKNTHIALMNLLWNDDKKAFIHEAYTQKFDIHPGLCAYLQSIGKMPYNPDLERYTDHSQYKDDLENWKPDKIKDEHTALALLFGLNPKYFCRFLALHYRFEEERNTRDMAPYYYFKPEEKWLFNNYHDFLKEEFPHLIGFGCPIFYIAPRYQKAKELNLWTGDFATYIQSLHDNGFIFMPKIYEALKKHGIDPSYSPDSWAIQFYKRWLQYPTWSLKQAARLYRGDDPDGGRSFESLGNTALHGSGMGFALEGSETIAEYDHNGEFVPPPDDNFDHIWKDEPDPHAPRYLLESFVRSHMDAGHISTVRDDGPEKLYFKPRVIVTFFRDYLNRTFRPKALYIAMGMNTPGVSLKEEKKPDYQRVQECYKQNGSIIIAELTNEKSRIPKKKEISSRMREKYLPDINEGTVLKNFQPSNDLRRRRTR